MATELFISLRRFTGIGLVLLLLSAGLCAAAAAQTTPPSVTVSLATPTAANMEYQSIWNIATSSHGDVLVMDFNTGTLYQIPADGRRVIPIITLGNTWANPGVAIDSYDALYFGNDWNGGISRIPYDPVAKTWHASERTSWAGDAVGSCCSVWWYHPTAMTVNANGVFVFGIENPSNTIFSVTVDAAGNYDTATAAQVTTGLGARPKSVALDQAGNIYFIEDGGSAVYRIPAGTTGLTGEAGLTRVDHDGWNPVGVAVDAQGNVYISDKNRGVYRVPNEDGTPNPSDSYLVTSLPAAATVAVDASGALFVPYTKPSAADPAVTVLDVSKVIFGGDLGSNLVTLNVYFAFNSDVSPANIALLQNGVAANFVKVGGNCDLSRTYHFGEGCNAILTLQQAGSVTGQVAILDATNDVLASVDVQGMALGTAKSSFSTPAAANTEYQSIWNIGISSHGDVVVMDFNTGTLYQVPADGRAVIPILTLGNTWANPGVALDSADTLYFGNDWNGGISRIPYDPVAKTWHASDRTGWAGDAFGSCCNVWWYHPTGMTVNANGLFVVGIENPSNTIFAMTVDPATGAYNNAAQIVTGLSARPKSVAVDQAGNIYFIEDGGSAVYRIPAGATGITGEASLARVDHPDWSPTGVAVDAQGNVYISDSKKGVYIVPNEDGTPNLNHTYFLTPLAAEASVAVAADNSAVYVPIKRPSVADPTKTVFDVYKVSFAGNLGFSLVNGKGSSINVDFSFNGDATPTSLVCTQNGSPVGSVVVGGNCLTEPPTTYHFGQSCTATLTLQPHASGPVSCQLVMLDAQNSILVSSDVQGTAAGNAVSASFAAKTADNAAYQSVWNIAASNFGDLLVMDFNPGTLYQIPPSGGPVIPILTLSNTWANPGVAVDPWNALYFGNDWNGGISRIPYDSVNKTWQASARSQWANGAFGPCCGVGWYHPDAMAVNSQGLFVVGIENPSNTIFEMTIDSAGNISNAAQVITGMAKRPRSIAVDEAGNIYYLGADGGSTVYRIPAGTTGLIAESSLTRVDHAGWNPTGVAVDPDGNVYISDKNKGVYVVPNVNGTPEPGVSYLVTTIPAQAGPALAPRQGVLFVPTTNALGNNDVTKLSAIGELGTLPAGAQSAPASIDYVFSADVSPAGIGLLQPTTPADFLVAGGDCSADPTHVYHFGDKCTATVTFQPHPAGVVAGQLAMQDAQNNILASNSVHGLAQGPVASFLLQPLEGTIGSGITAPQQVAVDALGNVYVADAVLGQVLKYTPSGTAIPIASGLAAPTGVAVDGGANVFFADSGTVTMVSSGGVSTVLSNGLGANVKLAVDGGGNLGVADLTNQRVFKLMTPPPGSAVFGHARIAFGGFTQLTAIGVDGSGNVLVADGANLIQIANDGTQTALANQLTGANGLAGDVSGALYVSQPDGVFRIPNIQGTLDFTQKVPRGTGIAAATGVAFDHAGNLFFADPVAQNLHVVRVHSTLNFGTLNLGDAPTLTADLFNVGNAPLAVAGFTSNNVIDFTATGCAAPIAVGESCTVAATMNPGPGEEGPLSGAITVDGNPANAPVYVYVAGTGAALAHSSSSMTIDPAATVVNIPVTVTVAPQEGSGVPTGQVSISVDDQVLGSGTLSNGSVLIHVTPPVAAGRHTFLASYQGDRVYGRSTASATATIAKGPSALTAVTWDQQQQRWVPTQPPTYVLSKQGGVIPADGTADPYLYKYVLHVTPAGIDRYAATNPTGTVTFMEGSNPACPYAIDNEHNTVTIDDQGNAVWDSSCLAVNPDTNVPHPLTPHTITAVYNGDGNYNGVTSPAVTFQILRNPSIIIAMQQGTSLNVNAGSTVNGDLSLTSLLGYGVVGRGRPSHQYEWAGPVELSCDGLPAHATCEFTPAQVADVTPDAPGIAVVTVRTNVKIGVFASASRKSNPSVWAFATMFTFGVVGLIFGRKTRYNGRPLMLICALLVISGVIAGMSACGTSTPPNTNPAPITPAGTYTVSITAKQVYSQNLVSLPYTFTLKVN